MRNKQRNYNYYMNRCKKDIKKDWDFYLDAYIRCIMADNCMYLIFITFLSLSLWMNKEGMRKRKSDKRRGKTLTLAYVVWTFSRYKKRYIYFVKIPQRGFNELKIWESIRHRSIHFLQEIRVKTFFLQWEALMRDKKQFSPIKPYE